MIWRGMLGIVVLLAIGVLFSADRRAIDRRLVVVALAIQFGIGVLALFVPWGRAVFAMLASSVETVLNYGQVGAAFLFGGLVGPRMETLFGGGAYVFAFRVLPAIVYVSALMAILYHWGVMQAVARWIGGGLCRVLGASTLESFSAVLTIFLGQSEMPVALAPYLAEMSETELFTVMCSGTASVAGSVLAAYAALGVPMTYLLAASFMAIPGGLLFAKILWPTPRAATGAMPRAELHATNLFDAIAEGAMSGARVAVAVGAMLVAFVGLIALIDGALQGIGARIGVAGLSLNHVLGVALAPVAWLIGIPAAEAVRAGGFLGQKLAFNEFVAYVGLSPVIHAHALSSRTIGIVSFALCGFSNFSSVGILIGAFGSIVPERRAFIARAALRCVLAGSLSNAMSATIAGLFLA
ncbi:NupC/NupG family nucleoside CNT transporter [Acidomonas methanolica]|uniref:Nucleoside permease n=1 Tax=Acidomonas methanolica NBRC 104435 TaxID=1231351 RepID=A0A023D1Q4_ACIMT|nr:nucleoside transporter C-terminal domain-containing protein [Acidomonas methanolica]MBU2654569.1 NupC/NupG family nucleoside CNT transporter [Acidomonas methanolica]TCS27442.1 CNT family concentrative nucleoside transporter [Acidomonas methanolica]GAJ28077.1 nucleoside permease [Acidomonas methanolica NBRC 104435]GBQ51783.1 nucleoside permease [Acidomonas methanolica]GEK98651.1 nucleoside permease [Acidomonas methanolica NBRC 104435]